MSLVIDRREDHKGQPGVHALIAAVDSYPYLEGAVGPPGARTLGFTQLSSSVATATTITSLLQNLHLPVPLMTIRLLTSGRGDIPDKASRCTLDEFLSAAAEWRRDAASHPDNVTWLYLVGHGLEMSTQLFLTEDFGNGRGALLRHAVDVSSIVNGMAVSRREPDMARTQWYFLDLSRQPAYELNELHWQNATSVFDAELPGFDEREAAVFYAAEAGRHAFGLTGGTTFFGQALIECLHTAQAAVSVDGRWCVTASSLISALNRVLRQRTAEVGGIQQRVAGAGSIRNSIICYLDEPPQVDVRLLLQTPASAGPSRVEVRTDTDTIVQRFELNDVDHAITLQLLPGLYRFTVVTEFPKESQTRTTNHLVAIQPPRVDLVIPVRYEETAAR